MDIDRFQFESTQLCLPTAFCLDYLIPGLAAEAGEVAGKYAKYIRDETLYTDLVIDLEKEIGDNFWFLVVLCEKLGLDSGRVLEKVLLKLQDRAKRNVLRGSGDNR
jgi:NTP pyrophosphatase (non-canonical NTP hydrolase)